MLHDEIRGGALLAAAAQAHDRNTQKTCDHTCDHHSLPTLRMESSRGVVDPSV